MKDYRILFPSEPFERKVVDSAYTEEYNVCKIIGIKTYLFDYEELVENDKLVSDISIDDRATLIYRGWMLKPLQYSKLYNKILSKTNGYVTLLNSPEEYQNCHCFPFVYGNIKEYTPKIAVLDNCESLMDLFVITPILPSNFFLKDYVKSIKTPLGVEKLSNKLSVATLFEKTQDFVKERGHLFTGGLVFKEFVDLKKVDGITNEWRAFFLYGNLVDLSINSDKIIPNQCNPPLEFVNRINGLLNNKSHFFTVDFALTEKNNWIVIETGDGGVSGLSPHCNVMGFYNKLFEI
jgi:hypothetical protein